MADQTDERTTNDSPSKQKHIVQESVGKIKGLFTKLASIRLGEEEITEPEHVEHVSEAEIGEKMDKFFNSVSDYAKCELSNSCSELKILEQMNHVTAAKYSELASSTEGLHGFVDDVASKHVDITRQLEEIELLADSVDDLFDVVKQVDEYSKSLEEKSEQLGYKVL